MLLAHCCSVDSGLLTSSMRVSARRSPRFSVTRLSTRLVFSSFRGGASGLKSCGTGGPADHPNGPCEAASPPRICGTERRARPVRRERGVPTLSRKRDASRPERKPTRAFATTMLSHILPPDSVVRPHVARSTGRSSPALNGGFVDPKGRPVGGAHKTPHRAN